MSVLAGKEKPQRISKLKVEVSVTSPAAPSWMVVPLRLLPLLGEQASVVDPVGGKVPGEGVADADDDEDEDFDGAEDAVFDGPDELDGFVGHAVASAPAGITVVVTDALQFDFFPPSEPPTPPPTAAAIITTTSARLRKKVGFLKPKIRPSFRPSPPGL